MKYVLIWMMTGTYPFSGSAEFNSLYYCEKAKEQIIADQRFDKLKVYCLPKG